MKYHIAIPSYKREVLLLDKTLTYLMTTNVDMKNVTVFVADKKEAGNYKAALQSLKQPPRIVVGVHTLCKQRAFIRKYYGTGACVFFIDDDVEALMIASSVKWNGMKPLLKLHDHINMAFDFCKSFNIHLWGFNAVCNPFFMYGKQESIDLKYVCGAAYGEIIARGRDVTLEDKEDFERTLIHYAVDGVVLRYNNIGIKTKYYNTPGGMQVTRTEKRVTSSAHALVRAYPQWCRINTTKKNQKHTEVQLIRHGNNKRNEE